jgi:hypothetical protein
MSLRLPIKGGARARVKGFITLEICATSGRVSVSFCIVTAPERVYYSISLSCSGIPSGFSDTPNIGAHRVSAEEQLTMPLQKKSKKSIPAETNREDHHPPQENEISLVPEPSNITDQERRAKLEALMKARAEKTAHTQEQPAEQQTHENVDDDDDTIYRELERVQQKIQQLQKDKE